MTKLLKKKNNNMTTVKYFEVTYYSPGTLFSEQTSHTFKRFDLQKFTEKAKTIKERHGAAPYGFHWKEMERPLELPEIDGFKVTVEPKTLKTSGTCYITGKLIFWDDIKDDRKLSTLASNIKYNSCRGIAIENCNSYPFTGSFEEKDCIIDWAGNVVQDGNAPKLKQYRKKIEAICDEEAKIWEKNNEKTT